MTSVRATYVNGMVSTASPERLLLLLLDRLRLDVQRAVEAQQLEQHQEAGGHLLHAQEIVLELRSTLDVDVWEGGPGLAALYDWIYKQLIGANTRRHVGTTLECLDLIDTLVETWRTAALSAASA